MTAKHLALATLLIVCTAPAGGAQQLGTSPAPANAAYLDVSVTDASGRPVPGLVAADFVVLAGGQAVPVDAAVAVRSEWAARVAGEPVRGLLAPGQVPRDVLRNDDVVGHHVAIVLDDILRPDEASATDTWMATVGLDLARAFVDRLTPDDRGTVFFSFLGRQQGLTSSRERLNGAIAGWTRRPIRPADCQSSRTVDGCVLDTFQRVAEALPVEPARPAAIIFISDRAGLPAVSLPAAGEGAETAGQRTLRTLQSARAVVYSITPAGVVPAGAADGLNLADATGGRALVDSTPQAAVDAVVNDFSTHYRLAVSSSAFAGGFRPLAITVGREGAVVRTRPGLFAPGGPVSPAGPGVSTPLEAAMVAPHQVRDVPVGAAVAVFAVPGRREAVVSITTAVTSAAVDGAGAWQAEVAATAFDPQWRPLASHRQTIEVTTPPGAGPRMVDVLSAVELIPGRYEVRVAAESGGRAGSVFVDLDVPEFLNAPLSASGLVLTTVPQPYAASPLLAETLPVTPTTRRLFRRNETADVFLRFYQGGRGRLRNMPVSLRIADASGTGIIQGDETIVPSQFTSDRSTDWRFSLPLDRLEPGEYLLTVEARIDDDAIARHVRFAVTE